MRREDLHERIIFGYAGSEFENPLHSTFKEVTEKIDGITRKYQEKLVTSCQYSSPEWGHTLISMSAEGYFKDVCSFIDEMITTDAPGYEKNIPTCIKRPEYSMKYENKKRKKEESLNDFFSDWPERVTNFAYEYAERVLYSRGFVLEKMGWLMPYHRILRSNAAGQILHPEK